MTLICGSAAHAGTVLIKNCGDAPTGGADTAWLIVNDNVLGYEAPTPACPPTGAAVGTDLDHAQILGRSVWTKLSSGVAASAGDKAEMRFTAPPGTTITAVNIKRDIGLRNDGYYVYGRSDAGQLTGETCARPGGDYGCNVGGYSAGYTLFTGLNAVWVAWGFQCGANGITVCGTGSSLHSAWVHIYASTVTLTDNQVPTGVSAGGTVTAVGWKGGTVPGTISGSDNLGVQKLRWYSDGALVSTSPDRTCDFSVTVPCTNAASATYSLNTSGLTDGSHSIQAAVVDPAGNETKGSTFSMQVDNTAPPAPTALNITGGGSSTAINMSWTAPAADGAAPYVSSAWEACSGGTCSSGAGGLTSASGSLPNVSGTYAVRVWLVDSAGNASQANSVTGSIAYTAPAASGGGGGGGGGGTKSPVVPSQPSDPTVPTGPTPSTPTTPTIAPPAPPTPERADAALTLTTASLVKRTGRLTLSGSLSRAVTGRVSVTITSAGYRRTTKARVSRGRYVLHLKLPRGTARARVTVRYGGSDAVKPARETRTVTSR